MTSGRRRLQVAHQVIDRAVDVPQGAGGHVEVADGATDTSMPQQCLDGAKVEALLQQVRGVAMAEGVTADGLVDGGLSCGGLDALADSIAADGACSRLVGEQPGYRTMASPVAPQEFQG